MSYSKWPKEFAPLTPEQKIVSDDFMKFWHEKLASNKKYSLIETFNHGYAVKHAPKQFLSTLEIGAGLGEHIQYEVLTEDQRKHYVVLELRENMAEKIRNRYPDINVMVGDCQQRLEMYNDYFDRILAIHVLEHLPNLPAAVKEMYRLCNKVSGTLSIVIPCEGGLAYSLARRISAQRLFEKRYNQSYDWFISREHINRPSEIIDELKNILAFQSRSFFPLKIPSINLNLCIGLTLKPK